MPGYRGTGQFVSKFVDTLQDPTEYITNWVQGITGFNPIAAPVASETASIGAAADTFNALLWSFYGAGNPGQALHSWTFPMIAYNFISKNQYCQCQRVSINANGATFVIGGGLGVFLDTNPQASTFGNGLTGYRLYTLTNAPTAIQLRRENGANSVLDIGGAAFNTFADGDLIRLEGRIISPTNVQLTCFQNGVQKFQINDDPSANFVPRGVPWLGGAIINGLAGTTGSPRNQWRNFECGLL